jgi:hypothetical protein|tara:strand:- start:50 stop:388 length:339 start_codon:yes stop_codon:yes gene_type:complete
MENLIELLVWILVVFGAANGIAVATVLEPVRNFFYPPSQWDSEKEKWVENPKKPWPVIGKLLQCPMCLGFWLGGLLGLYWFSPSSSFIGDAFFGSATSWMLYILIQKRQFGA